MTIIEYVEQELIDNDIEVINHHLYGLKAACLKINDRHLIAINRSKIECSRDLYIVYMHEYEHLQNPCTMYNFSTAKAEIRRKEKYLNRKLAKKIIPLEKLIDCLSRGMSLSDVAEILHVTDEFMYQVYQVYKDDERWVSYECAQRQIDW